METKTGAGAAATPPTGPALLAQVIGGCRRAFAVVFAISLFLNLLMLTAPLYMLQVFDRVLGGGSTETLLYLTVIAIAGLFAFAVLEAIRGRAMIAIGSWFDRRLSGAVLNRCIARAASGKGTVQGLRDLAIIRNFIAGPAVSPVFDTPWTPMFLGVMFLFHPLLGWMALAGAVVLLALAVANDAVSRKATQKGASLSIRSLQDAEAATRNADAVMAMGIVDHLVRRWNRDSAAAHEWMARAGRRSGDLASASKFVRMALQLGVLGAGAYLAIHNELTPGTMIASSILLTRALAPIDQAINAWRSGVAAWGAYGRVGRLLGAPGVDATAMKLERPKGVLTAAGLAYAPDGAAALLRGLSFEIGAGESLGVIGETATGKTTLSRLLVGNLRPTMGHARLDGADTWHWQEAGLGRHVGYLPQDVELFAGTVRDNIARLGEAESGDVVAAARMAGVHEMILALPLGYDTPVGENGTGLSAGQRQRVALARALFGEPGFVVLDEPNANLDHKGEAALLGALTRMRDAGMTTVVIAHRPSVLRHVDHILVLRADSAPAFGPRDEILPRVTGPVRDQQHRIEEEFGHGQLASV